MNRRYTAAALAVAALGMLTACSDSTSGSPETEVTSSASSPKHNAPGARQAQGVPSIGKPIDAPKLKSDPCRALSQQQVQQLGLKPGTHESASFGPLCEYEYTDVVGNQVSVEIVEKFDRGLADVYARKDGLAYFKATTVSGYPGAYVSKDARQSKSVCQLYVGLNSGLAPAIYVQLSGGTDYGRPCEVAEMAAKAMIENLKG